MAWSIQWTDRAIRDLAKLDPPVARRIVAKVEEAAEDPKRFFARLRASADYKLRIGDYRLLAALSYDAKTVYVQRVGHRSRIYERTK